MRNYYLWVFVTIMLLGAETLTSAEIIPVWHKVNEAGEIHDMEFLRGEDQFILIAGTGDKGQIQIRQTLTGELLRSFPLPIIDYFNQLEITPDSMRFVITTGGDAINKASIELRNISDFSLIKKLIIPMDADSVDKYNQPFSYLFQDIVIDPVRPYIYTFITKTNHYSDDVPDRTWLRVYNYETMEEVKDLTPNGFENEQMKSMDISDDGRYLAVLNEGKAYLKIWDLQTMELIKSKQLYDDQISNPQDYYCKSDDIEFSHIDNDLIYFSGEYPKKNNEVNPFGIYDYSFINNNIEKKNLNQNIYSGLFKFFDQEGRLLILSGSSIIVLNQITNQMEIIKSINTEIPFGKGIIYSLKNNIFLGFSGKYYGSIKYDSQTIVESGHEQAISISPNPTDGYINIFVESLKPTINYQISDLNGLILKQSSVKNQSGNIQLDFSTYPNGIYFLTINYNNQPKTYKIIKEG